MEGPPLRTLDSTRRMPSASAPRFHSRGFRDRLEPGNTPAPAWEACLGVALEGRFHLHPEWTSWPLHIDPVDAGTLCL